ncbi:hypothetical protein AVEN_119232-1 [Araneus ventricosus]|uniref:Uncharacterized protein n=1 Tax=Araneus ventricosus TaxID=182803 RepID=A0A4Y2QNA7_ARAVE|nr:hypothetical protein AVEN_119232-1 [Araneus ventricosus]
MGSKLSRINYIERNTPVPTILSNQNHFGKRKLKRRAVIVKNETSGLTITALKLLHFIPAKRIFPKFRFFDVISLMALSSMSEMDKLCQTKPRPALHPSHYTIDSSLVT